jgi:hypothetical protein
MPLEFVLLFTYQHTCYTVFIIDKRKLLIISMLISGIE